MTVLTKEQVKSFALCVLAALALSGCGRAEGMMVNEGVLGTSDDSLVFVIPAGANVLVRIKDGDFVLYDNVSGKPWTAPYYGGASIVVERGR